MRGASRECPLALTARLLLTGWDSCPMAQDLSGSYGRVEAAKTRNIIMQTRNPSRAFNPWGLLLLAGFGGTLSHGCGSTEDGTRPGSVATEAGVCTDGQSRD